MEQCELESKYQKVIYDFYYEKLKFCGCGRPDFTLEFIKKLLNEIDMKSKNYENKDYDQNRHKYYEQYKKNLINIFEFIDKTTEESYLSDIQDGIIQFVLYYLDEVEILEHGSSIGGAWLSEYGREVLTALNYFDDLEDVMI